MTSPTSHPDNSVLIVGAGIAGMAAALHLAGQGVSVHLLDSAPSIGGSLHLLDHTFPTNSCGLCLMLPQQPAFCPTFECDLHPNLHLHPYTDLLRLDGDPGAFSATLRHKSRYVHADRCDGCARCAAVCPEARPHDYEGWLHPVKAIYRPPGLRAVPDTWLIDREVCTRCGRCVEACPTGAIDLDLPPVDEALPTAAVLLTPGFAPFDARLKGEYGYQVYDNVVSSLEFERMVSLAGSTVAHLRRPSGGQPPAKIAFVHCVGSRDELCGAGHCSSACCMYTAKQVALAKQLDPSLDITVFFMDLRAFGKNFEAYLDQVQALPGVTYRRAMPSAVYQLQQSRDLVVSFVGEEGRLQEEAFDLLVLAVGFAPPPGMQQLARDLGLPLNDYGFLRPDPYQPTHTPRPGLFVAGAFREPKDIPDTVAEAAAAAAEVAAFLRESTGHPLPRPLDDAPASPARPVAEEPPRTGVFFCRCNGTLAGLDLAQLSSRSQALPGVTLAETVDDGCSAQGRAAMQRAIDDQQLNRVVFAGCSHRLLAPEFDDLMRQAQLDPRLLARVNLRDQVIYPHHGPGSAGDGRQTAKAYSLVAMAVAQLTTMTGLEALARGTRQALSRRALVLGGGAAGLTAALTLARLDIPVHLVEREDVLGGQWRHIRYQPEALTSAGAPAPQAVLAQLIDRVQADDRITILLNTELAGLEGGPGRYRAHLTRGDEARQGGALELEHGVLVVATGGVPAQTSEYLYGQHPAVLTQRELEQHLADESLPAARRGVMIQCAGSREPGRAYCSRLCCTQAVKNALKLKEARPELELYVLYRDLRTFGFREAYYQAARDAGVVFVRYELPDKPQVSAQGERLRVQLTEPVTGQVLALEADLLVLSTGIDAAEQRVLAETLGVVLDGDGFFREEHAKMKPLDLAGGTRAPGGFFVAGLAHSPRFLEETLAQAQGAAMRAAAFLAPQVVTERPTSVWVNERLCSFCGLCVEACPFQARVMNYDSRVADVDYALCQGCGVCAMVCPNKATLQKTFEQKQLMAAIDMALV